MSQVTDNTEALSPPDVGYACGRELCDGQDLGAVSRIVGELHDTPTLLDFLRQRGGYEPAADEEYDFFGGLESAIIDSLDALGHPDPYTFVLGQM